MTEMPADVAINERNYGYYVTDARFPRQHSLGSESRRNR